MFLNYELLAPSESAWFSIYALSMNQCSMLAINFYCTKTLSAGTTTRLCRLDDVLDDVGWRWMTLSSNPY